MNNFLLHTMNALDNKTNYLHGIATFRLHIKTHVKDQDCKLN